MNTNDAREPQTTTEDERTKDAGGSSRDALPDDQEDDGGKGGPGRDRPSPKKGPRS